MTMTKSQLDQMTAQRRSQAEARHASYPQYAGYFDGWVLAVATRDLRSKGGLQASQLEVVLANPFAVEDARAPELTGLREFYSSRLGWNCLVRPDSLRFVVNPGGLV